MSITWTPEPRTKTLRAAFARSTARLLRTYAEDPDGWSNFPGMFVKDAAALARLQGIPLSVALRMFGAAYAQGPNMSPGAIMAELEEDEAGGSP